MKIPQASLKFSAYAWAKLQYVLNLGNTEVGMFGLTDSEDPLTVLDLVMPPQEVTESSVEFSGDGVADYYEDCIELGLQPNQYARIWIHTHPMGVYKPSALDEKTFKEVFGKCDWAIMYILTKDQRDYCALQYNKIPSHRVELTGNRVDFSIPFCESRQEEWAEEYKKNVKEKVFKKATIQTVVTRHPSKIVNVEDAALWESELKKIEREERLAKRLEDTYDDPYFWDDECWGNDLYTRGISPQR